MNHRRTFSLLVVAMLTLAAAAELAAQDLKIGVVNTRRLARESRAGQQSLSRIKEMGDRLRASIQTQQDAYQKRMADFRSRAAVMPPDERRVEQERLQKRGIELKRAAEDARVEIEREGKKVEEEVNRTVLLGLQEYARVNGYDLILDHMQCLFNSEVTDITQDVLKFLDSKGP